MALRPEDYSIHFDEDVMLNYMFMHTYDNVTFKSNHNGFYYNIQVEPMDDMYHDYYIDWVEHVPTPDAVDKASAKDYIEWQKQEAIRRGLHLQK
jgi:hypothetical protein